MPRQARLDFPGTLHHALGRGIEKQEIVTDARDWANFVTRLGQSTSVSRTVIYAWVLMPNHAHILLRSGGNFVEKMVEEAGERQKRLFSGSEVTVKKLMESLCRKEGVCLSELRGRSR
jgi:REP element-mobilizing transposase RayT